jgi:DNA-binding phage protein
MALTRNFKKTVVARVERDPAFAKALLDEAATLFLSDEPETARVILRDLVNATLGFEQLAKMTETPSKSLHRMLSPKGNPSMDNLAAIFGAIGSRLKVGLRVHTIRAAQREKPACRSLTVLIDGRRIYDAPKPPVVAGSTGS